MNGEKKIPAELYLHLSGQLAEIFCSDQSCWCHRDTQRIWLLSEALNRRLITADQVGLYFDGVLSLPQEVMK